MLASLKIRQSHMELDRKTQVRSALYINKPKTYLRMVKGLQNQMARNLKVLFSKEDKVSVAYLFGSYAKGNQTSKSDIDVAVLLSEIPRKILRYLHLINEPPPQG